MYPGGVRTLVFAAAILVACQQHKDQPAPTPPPAPVKPDAAVVAIAIAPDAAVVAVAPDAAPIDAAVPVDADHTFDLFNSESIGPLKPGIDENVVISVLGQPTSKSKAVVEAATGDTVSNWKWAQASISMSRDDKKRWVALSVSITGPETLETRQHIHIGSTRRELEKAYIRAPEDEGKQDSYLVGSVYGGLLFGLDHDRVSRISLGAFAF